MVFWLIEIILQNFPNFPPHWNLNFKTLRFTTIQYKLAPKNERKISTWSVWGKTQILAKLGQVMGHKRVLVRIRVFLTTFGQLRAEGWLCWVYWARPFNAPSQHQIGLRGRGMLLYNTVFHSLSLSLLIYYFFYKLFFTPTPNRIYIYISCGYHIP